MNGEISYDEKRWRAESDARTLSEAEVIKGDDGRMKAAAEVAKKLAEEKKSELKGLTKLLRYPTMRR